jgi:hypothetical protein
MRIVTLLTGCILMLSASLSAASAPDYGCTPVLFVYGHGGSAAKWHKLMFHLLLNGYPSKECSHAVGMTQPTMTNIQAMHFVAGNPAKKLRQHTLRDAGK